jgi:hypothetical protein
VTRAGKVHGRSPWAAGQQGRRPRRPDRHVLGAAAGGTLSDGPGGGRGHDLRWTQGVQIGNHNTQINIFAGAVTFTAPGPVSWPVRVGAVPALADCYQVRDEASSLRVVIQCDAGHGPLDARSLQRTPGSGARLARPA